MLRVIAATLVAFFATAAATRADEVPHRVLFIGNSLTYVNDLPNAFASLAPKDMHLEVDMIASAGASLADAARNPLVAQALSHGKYAEVVLQERGGEAFCPVSCQQNAALDLPATVAAKDLAHAARAGGARVFYLGTWQTDRETNEALEYGERAIAKASEASYVEIAESRRQLMLLHPDLAWTHADGQHPGYATTAMMALRTWRAMFGAAPATVPCVAGEVHYHAPKPDGVLHIDTSLTPRTCLVSADVVPALSSQP